MLKIWILYGLCFASVFCTAQDQIEFSHRSGFYHSNFALKADSKEGNTIRFTSDGTVPTANSEIFKDSIPVTSLRHIPDVISNYQTGIRPIYPMRDSYKANVFLVASFDGAERVSEIYALTFWIDIAKKSRYANWPIISMLINEEEFFNDTIGIYTKGINDNYYKKGNEWEREVTVQYFDSLGTEVFTKQASVNVHGGRSREQAQKSLKLDFHDQITDHFFNASQNQLGESVILRNGMSCWQKSIFKDDITAEVCQELAFPYAESKGIILFINGEYWGIHSLRPHFNTEYFKTYLETDSLIEFDYQDFDNINHPIELKEFYKELNLLNNLDFRKEEHYAYASNLFDIPNMVDYYCAEIFFNNKDWPHHNYKLVWDQTNHKILHVFNDMDAGWTNSAENTMKNLIENKQISFPKNPAFLLRKFMTNDGFKKIFFQRFMRLLITDFSSDNLLNKLDQFYSHYKPLVSEHGRRWTIPGTLGQWEGKVGMLRSFAKERTTKMKNQIEDILTQEN